jgi:hypothetical protein
MQSKLIKKQKDIKFIQNWNTLPKSIISYIKNFFDITDNIKIQLIDVKWYKTKYIITDLIIIKKNCSEMIQYVANNTIFYNIENLDLFGIDNITNDIINFICNISNLKKLNLAKTNVTDDHIKLLLLKRNNNISDLNISDCRYLTDTCMSYITSFPNLQNLNLSYSCFITERGISYLSGNNSLISLNLSDFCYAKNSLVHIAKIKNLEKLDISYNSLNNIEYLTNNKKLETLCIDSYYEKYIREIKSFDTINIIYKYGIHVHICSRIIYIALNTN